MAVKIVVDSASDIGEKEAKELTSNKREDGYGPAGSAP